MTSNKQRLKIEISECNLCGGAVKLLHPTKAYGSKYKHHSDPESTPGKAISFIYRCVKCDAQVWCHWDSTKPFWTLADKKTRDARHQVHLLLDPIWKKEKSGNYKTWSRGKRRKELYKLLSKHLDIPLDKTHMWMFTIEQCREAYVFFHNYKVRNNIK